MQGLYGKALFMKVTEMVIRRPTRKPLAGKALPITWNTGHLTKTETGCGCDAEDILKRIKREIQLS